MSPFVSYDENEVLWKWPPSVANPIKLFCLKDGAISDRLYQHWHKYLNVVLQIGSEVNVVKPSKKVL